MTLYPFVTKTVQQRGWLVYTITLVVFYAASSVPTPLYPLYQKAFDLSYPLLMAIFAAYAFSLILTLLVVGEISDYIGRRPALLIALLILGVSVLLFILAKNAVWLVVARVLQGVAIGMGASAAGAALLDTGDQRGALINSLAPLCGMAVGALASGGLAQYAPYPLELIHCVMLALLLLLAIGLCYVRETAGRRQGIVSSLKPRICIPAPVRPYFMKMTPINVAVWALAGLYLSLVPSLVREATSHNEPLLGALVVGALTTGGAVSVFSLRNASACKVLRKGIPMMITGVALLLSAAHLQSAGLMVAATFIAGFGFGANFLGVARTIMPLAVAEQRAGLLSAYYIECYLASSLPAIMAGFLAGVKGIVFATDLYGLAVILLTFAGLNCLRATGQASER